MEKPDVDSIEGLSPAISIQQKTTAQNPRSTVGTVTEIYDYMRLLWARAGVPLCPNDGTPITRSSASQIADTVMTWPAGTRIEVLGPMVRGRKGEFKELFDDLGKQGFVRARVDGATYDLADVPTLHRRTNHDIAVLVDRMVVKADDRARLTDSIETALRTAEGIVEVVRHPGGASTVFSERFACPVCGLSLPELEPRQFSFNSPFGACAECHGVGTARIPTPELVLGDAQISILEGVVLPWGEPSGYLRKVVLPTLARTFKFDLNTPWGELTAAAQKMLLHGAAGKKLKYVAEGGKGREVEGDWEGILANLSRRYRESSSDTVRHDLEGHMIERPCPVCQGKRLRRGVARRDGGWPQYWRHRRPADRRCNSIAEGIPVGRGLGGAVDPDIAGPILKEVVERLAFLRDVGLEYLTLGRSGGTLSGGEAQRIRLATQIGSRLVGVLYILDELADRLHQREQRVAARQLRGLRDLGNTVIVVGARMKTLIREADQGHRPRTAGRTLRW